MNKYTNTGVKIRVHALGCGTNLSQRLMVNGASEWLHSINLIYAKEVTHKLFGEFEHSFVSRDMIERMMNSIEKEDGIIDVFITASLHSHDQQLGRLNKFYYCVRDSDNRGICQHDFYYEECSREEQESIISDTIIRTLKSIKKDNTQVVYSGSFNPFHDGHEEVLWIAKDYTSGSKAEIVIEMSKLHPEKGLVSEEEIIRRLSFIKPSWRDKVVVTECPTYLDKYNHFNELYEGKKDIIFLVGYDVWSELKESFEDDFGDINNVKFLVSNRYENRRADQHRLLLNRSFCDIHPPYILNTSSSEIREKIQIEIDPIG